MPSNPYKSASKGNGKDQSISGNDKTLHGLALAELVSYIISKSQDYNESKPTVFKLADLVKIYSTILTRLGVENTQIHSTDLKKRILAQIPVNALNQICLVQHCVNAMAIVKGFKIIPYQRFPRKL